MAERGRQPVAQGGMWSTPKPQYSQQTQELLKVMMKESRLTNFQQRQLDKAMKEGEALPKAVNPTSSAKPRKPLGPPVKKNNSKVIDPRAYNPAVRTREDIEAAGAYDRDQFVPTVQTKYGGKYEKEKARLGNMMAYGEDIVPESMKVQRPRPRTPDSDPDVDRFDELQAEIEERRKFMQEMENYGKGGQFKVMIETEISQKIREMEVIDKKRTQELERVIAQQDSQRHPKGIPHAKVS